MKKYLLIFFSLLLFSINTHASENPYKFLKKEVLLGKASSELKNDTRSISKKKALSIFEDTDGRAIKITLDTKFKGNKKDWERTGERNQRWETANKKKPRKKRSALLFFMYAIGIPGVLIGILILMGS